MAKFFGKVGYAFSHEKTIDDIPSGVWIDEIVERNYYGDVLRIGTRWQNGVAVNDDLKIMNRIQIIADAFAYENFSSIKYVIWCGIKWKVTEILVERPRISLTLGGEYNGQ